MHNVDYSLIVRALPPHPPAQEAEGRSPSTHSVAVLRGLEVGLARLAQHATSRASGTPSAIRQTLYALHMVFLLSWEQGLASK